MGVCTVCNAEVADDKMEEHGKMHEGSEASSEETSMEGGMESDEEMSE